MNKIILIDDNKSNQREAYGASFVDIEEYRDCLFHVEQLNENSDFSFLDDAVCVLLRPGPPDGQALHFPPCGGGRDAGRKACRRRRAHGRRPHGLRPRPLHGRQGEG